MGSVPSPCLLGSPQSQPRPLPAFPPQSHTRGSVPTFSPPLSLPSSFCQAFSRPGPFWLPSSVPDTWWPSGPGYPEPRRPPTCHGMGPIVPLVWGGVSLECVLGLLCDSKWLFLSRKQRGGQSLTGSPRTGGPCRDFLGLFLRGQAGRAPQPGTARLGNAPKLPRQAHPSFLCVSPPSASLLGVTAISSEATQI